MIIEKLYNSWQKGKDDPKVLVRLAFECWHALSERDFVGLSDKDLVKLKSVLIELKDYVKESNIQDSYVLMHCGYMISLFLEFFYENGEDELYNEIQALGTQMLQKATEIDPSNQIAELMKLGNAQNEKAYRKLRKQIRPQIEKEYRGESGFDEYFREVLTLEL